MRRLYEDNQPYDIYETIFAPPQSIGGVLTYQDLRNNDLVRGDLQTTRGYIGGAQGWIIEGGILKSVGIGLATTQGNVTYAFWAGDDNPANAEFRVTHAGVLTATGATITGTITATTGTIGGFTITATTIASGSITLDSSVPSIALGSATAYLTGTGIWMGLSGGAYKEHIGNPSGDHLKWDGTNLYVTGTITATTAVIASTTTDTFTINSDLTNTNVDLVFGRTTGGNATMRYNGTTVNVDKTFTVSGTTVVLETRALTAGAGLTGGGDLSSDRTFTVGAGNGITVNADDVALTTPGTLTVSTSNSSVGNHTHAITSSSNPGAAASLLATDASGFLTLEKLTTPIISAAANLTISPTGDVIFDPTGNDILPNTNYDLNFGSLTKKYLTLHAAELWVETLVAQNTLATIGGRILVGPTTELIADLTAIATTIDVKHNEMASGDRVYMEANGSVEFMSIDSGATTITGGYRYTVTRNLDGSGANTWSAGDAVFNTGAAGDGFIDLYSVNGVKAASEAGPTIVGNVRNSTTYNDWTAHWAIGNLNGLYGYGATTYGVALGEYAASRTHITLDSTNGLRFFNGTATVIGQWDTSGNITVGQVAASQSNVYISSGAISMRNNTTVVFNVDASGNVLVGQTGASQSNVYITAGSVQLRTNTTAKITLGSDGDIDLDGSLTVGTAGYIRGGATAYKTGTGFFIGYSTDAYKFHVGNPSGDYIAFDGTDFDVNGFVLTGIGAFGGNGSDGALNVTSGTTTIDLGGAQVVIKNYTSINVSAGATLAFSNPHANGTLIILKSKGNVTIAGTVDASAMGASGGAGAESTGTAGTVGTGVIKDTNASAGGTGLGVAGGTAGVAITLPVAVSLAGKVINLTPGGGGGGGVTGNADAGPPKSTGGTGGRGGAALYFECLGAWNFTGTITVAGAVGGNATAVTGNRTGGGGGGGGSGGMIVALYKTLTADSGTYTVSGGAGGNGANGGGGTDTAGGGAGGAGGSHVSAGGNGGAGGTGSGSGSAGSAGGGASGGAAGSAGSGAGTTAGGGGGGGGATGTSYSGTNQYFA